MRQDPFIVAGAPPALVLAAPSSASGKTVLTLALLRHFRNSGITVAGFKVGPDYIDAAFHRAASGRPAYNFDGWAMRPATLDLICARAGDGAELMIGEGVMGLFDGAADGTGSTADMAAHARLPVVLVVDVKGQGGSAAALIQGFTGHRADVEIAGVLFNRVASVSHRQILADAVAGANIPILGFVPTDAALALPGRHLGLVQAWEHPDLDGFLDRAAEIVGAHVECDTLRALARPPSVSDTSKAGNISLPVPGRRIAVADDAAFAFLYPHVVESWRASGAEAMRFSPLADEAPDPSADAVFLPGGYPELHGGRLAANGKFLGGLRDAAARGAVVYGECGGYMVLGEGLVDGDGVRHAMAGLVGLETSFAEPKLHLGYRQARLLSDGPLGAAGSFFRGHEFHYATVLKEQDDASLFDCRDARGEDAGSAGCRRGRVMGSFVHLIDAV